MSEILKNLNPAQREAVVNFENPSLIVAGAGSGKTRVLTSRIAYMLQSGVQPWRILALTFTNKAAREMRERIGRMVSADQSERLWMGTFHSIFLKILRMEADKLGYTSSFTIYDTADSRNLIKTIVKEMQLPDDIYKPAAIQSRISLAKNNLVTADAYAANTAYISEDRQRKMSEFSEIYKAYTRKCKENMAMDFDDMLLNINILFRDFPDVLAKYQERFLYILVDEYQDTNYAQYIIIRRLAERHSRVCVVGDDSQSIYSFRGAKIENILRFRNDFPSAQTFKLEQNYRSTRTIVGAANSVIEKNRNRIEKESFSEGDKGDNIKVIKAYTDQEEAAIVADELRNLARSSGVGWREVALLYRTNMQSRVFEESFRRRDIPYRIYGGMSFYQRKEIKDILAYMHLVVNPRNDEAFKRVVNYPARGIGSVTVGRILDAAAQKGCSALELVRSVELKEIGLNAGTATRVKEFSDLITSFADNLSSSDLYQFGLDLATRSGIIGNYKADHTPEAQSALDNIEELLNSIQNYAQDARSGMEYDPVSGEPLEGAAAEPSITEWLQSITLLTDMDEEKEKDDDHVTLMTVHAAKGLEYKYVFIVGLEENLFPSQMSMTGEEGIEEERRLFYVALTRAMEGAYITFSETRFRWGSMEFCRPSRFLSEIDSQYLDISFDLDEEKREQSPAAKLSANYRDHNARAGEYRNVSSSGNDYYGGGKTIRGRDADRYAGAGERNKTPDSVKPTIPVTMKGREDRFRSIGTRREGSSGDRAASVPGIATNTGTVPAEAGQYATGQRVEHGKFGTGTIKEIEKMAADLKITVAFDDHGKKTLLSKFARLQIIG